MKQVIVVKKLILGIVIGIAIATAGSVYADEVKSLVGRTIEGEFPIKLDGKTIDKPAIVIEGTSYLPVRTLGDALNLDVSFNADLGIELKKKLAEVKPMPTIQPLPTLSPPPRIAKVPMTKEAYLSSVAHFGLTIEAIEKLIVDADKLLQYAIKENNPGFIDSYTKNKDNLLKALELTQQDRLAFIALYPEYQE